MSSTNTRRSPHARDDRGAVAVEFALVVPVLVMLMFGIVSGGMAFYQKITLADAVREGARFAATADASASGWASSVKNRTVAAATGELTTAQVCVTPPTGSGDCPPSSSPAPAGVTGLCVVRVRAEKSVYLDVGLTRWGPYQLVSDTYARYERPC